MLPTSKAAFVGDSETSLTFQKTRHQNNLYYAQEMLKGSEDDSTKPSKYLLDVSGAIAGAVKKFPSSATVLDRARLVQDALALQHIYLEIDEIKTIFFEKETVNTKLTATDFNEFEWGKLAFNLMMHSVHKYNGIKGIRPDSDQRVEGETRTAYSDLETHLTSIKESTKPATTRNDLWFDVQKTAGGKKDAVNDYMGNFAKKARFTAEKINRHENYLDTEFYLLASNAWWADKKANSEFHAHVSRNNPELRRQTLVRKTSEPRRESNGFQSVNKENATRRVVFKNAPFSMEQLAKLMNSANQPVFNTDAVGTTPPVSALDKQTNPFNNAVFKILDKWYIVAAEVNTSGQLIMQKVELQTIGSPAIPLVEPKDSTQYKRKEDAVPTLLSTTDLLLATDRSNKKIKLTDIIEDGLDTLIKNCGYGVVDNSVSDDEFEATIRAKSEHAKTDEPTPVLFAMRKEALGAVQFNDADKAALLVIVQARITGELLAMLKDDQKATSEALSEKILELTTEYHQKFGDLVPALTTDEVENLRKKTPQEVVELQVKAFNQCRTNAKGATAFPSQAVSFDKMAVALDKQFDELVKTPPSKELFYELALSPLEEEIIRYRAKGDLAVGWVRQNDTQKGECVLLASTADTQDYMALGMAYFNAHNSNKSLSVTVENKTLYVEPCDPPATGAIDGKKYYRVTEDDPKTRQTGTEPKIYKPTLEQRVKLQTELQTVLLNHAAENKKLMKDDFDIKTVASITPDPANPQSLKVSGGEVKPIVLSTNSDTLKAIQQTHGKLKR